MITVSVQEPDITFNDDLEEEDLELINEVPENFNSLPIVPVQGKKYLKFEIRSPDEFSKLINREGLLRKKIKMLDDARGTIRSKVHSLYALEITHKGDQRKYPPTFLFFLKLYASDKEG
jgi:hypothetical protein